MKNRFYGRKAELTFLSEFLKRDIATLGVITGRRRIGKSRLIQEFSKAHTFYEFTGMPPSPGITKSNQLDQFSRQLSLQSKYPKVSVDDWTDLFFILSQQTKTGRVIILLDEISWMGSKDPNFLGKLKSAWDIYFKKNPNLILILCGSVSSWIEKNILSSTGFMGRVSFKLSLEELPITDCNKFWLQNEHISPFEKLKVLSVTGGIPRYLEEIDPGLTAEENIRNLCFKKDGLLVREFNNIFNDLFSRKGSAYKEIVQILANGPMTIKDICEKMKITQSGFISECLETLVKTGFISRDYTWRISSGKPSSLSHFRLSDNYLRFYLKYIDKELHNISNNMFGEKSLSSLPGWNSIMGLQFENLVLNNRHYIYRCLKIRPEDIICSNPFFQRSTSRQPGCQIDFLIQTKLDVLYACEVKFSRSYLRVDVIDSVKQKIERLKLPKRTSCKPILIHVNGVHDDIEDSGYFAKIIDFSCIFDSERAQIENAYPIPDIKQQQRQI